MRGFIERALAKVPRMNAQQLESFLYVLAGENERLEAVFDSLIEGVIVCDASHVPVLCNKTAERLIPFSSPEPYDKKLWESIDDEEISRFLREALTGEDRIIDREFALNSRNTTKIVTVSVTPLVKDRHIQGTLVTAGDITEKRRKEAQLRRAENLASLTTLAAGVAHEIKNPLGSMSIHVQLIKKALRCKGSESCDDALDRYTAVIDEEIERLNRIVVDFLFAVRPMNIEPIEADIDALIRELADFVAPELRESGVDIKVELCGNSPRVRVDARFMKQAILNLVKNAQAAMPDGGLLTISTVLREGTLDISIADTGTGISDDNLSKIFEPYFTTKDNGTGLGLTLAFKIVKEHDGEISVTTKEGKGSAFTISLPVPQKETRLIEYSGRSDAAAAAGSRAAEVTGT
ncbi:MAG: ATP-binding protein [Spirochaetes bacterium]|nr:ATP-binding protein [Spirochaetota bacterium]